VLQSIREQCEPTSDWAQFARQMAENQLDTVKISASGNENQLEDANAEHVNNTLMTTRC